MGEDWQTSITIPSVDDWWQLTREYPEFRAVSNTVLKDYGYMAIFRFIDWHRPRTMLEFGHGMNAVLLSRYQERADVWGVDDYNAVPYFPDKAGWEAQYQKDVVDACPRARLVRGLLAHPTADTIPEAHFDLVCSVSVLEEIELDTVRQITEHAYRLLKPGGFYVNTHDLLLEPTFTLLGVMYARRDAYIEIQRAAGFQLSAPRWVTIDLHKVLLENPAAAMLYYQGYEPEKRTYRGHWTTMFSIARKPERPPSARQ